MAQQRDRLRVGSPHPRYPDLMSHHQKKESLTSSHSWAFWGASLQPVFAALTTIFAKVGVRGDSVLATLIRTIVIIVVLSLSSRLPGNG